MNKRIKEIILLVFVFLIYSILVIFVVLQKSLNPVILSFSKNYFLGVVIPIFLIIPLLFIFIKFKSNLAELSRGNKKIGNLIIAFLFLLNIILWLYSGNIGSNDYIRLVLPFFGFFFTGVIIYSTHDLKILPQILVILFSLFMSIIFCELIVGVVRPEGNFAEWVDAFKYRVFTEDPFFGEGGRFKPGLHIKMNSPFKRNGVNFITNSKGFRNNEEVDYSSETIRILLLGDSFTNGYRIDQEKFFGYLLEKNLSHSYKKKFQVLNTEIAYPGLGLSYLKKYGFSHNPQIVIYGLCGNDILQTYIFVGENRLFSFDDKNNDLVVNEAYDKKNGDLYNYITNFKDLKYVAQISLFRKLVEKVSNSIPNYYHSLKRLNTFQPLVYLKNRYWKYDGETMFSFLSKYEVEDGYVRLFNGNANLGFYLKAQPKIAAQMLDLFQKIILNMKESCDEKGLPFILINFPLRFQINPQDWQAEKRKWRLKEQDFDLEKLNKQIFKFCQEYQINYLDLLYDFKNTAQRQQFFFPGGDMHFNEQGHELAAAAVAQQMVNFVTGEW